MDTSKEYIKMCDYPRIQKQIKDDRCSFWAKKRVTGKYSVWCSYHSPGDIWLPRQDQIQEIMGCIPGNHLSLMNKLCKFNYYYSLEQKWLAFYMYEKCGKKWNGKEWS